MHKAIIVARGWLVIPVVAAWYTQGIICFRKTAATNQQGARMLLLLLLLSAELHMLEIGCSTIICCWWNMVGLVACTVARKKAEACRKSQNASKSKAGQAGGEQASE
jgi:hypothetical protein